MALASTPGHTHCLCRLPPNSRVVGALPPEDLEVEQSLQSGQILERVVKAQLWLWLLVQM